MPAKLAIALCASFAAASCAASTEVPVLAPAPEAQALEMEFEAGELLSIVMPKIGDGSPDAREDYYMTAIPLAQEHGLRSKGSLRNADNLIGEYDPDGIIFYSWPGEQSEKAFTAHPDWPGLKALRRAAWEEVRVYTETLAQPLALRFDPAKTYTLAVAWTNPEHPGDYARYMDNVIPLLGALGARVIHIMHNPRVEAHAASPEAPERITIIEWPSEEALDQLRQSPAYRRQLPLLRSGIEHLEFYRIAPASS
ncbi:MAG: DUF1330 domain-containing protein [Erythrobacter sp.]